MTPSTGNLKHLQCSYSDMVNRWRPSFDPEYKETVEGFLKEHDELPFTDPKEFMKFCTDQLITEVETSTQQIEKAKEQLDELQKQLEE